MRARRAKRHCRYALALYCHHPRVPAWEHQLGSTPGTCWGNTITPGHQHRSTSQADTARSGQAAQDPGPRAGSQARPEATGRAMAAAVHRALSTVLPPARLATNRPDSLPASCQGGESPARLRATQPWDAPGRVEVPRPPPRRAVRLPNSQPSKIPRAKPKARAGAEAARGRLLPPASG